MKHIESCFKGARSMDIYYQAWLPDKGIKAVLLIVHGLGEHSGRYMNIVNHFVPIGYAVYALDHIGHGRSSGRREYIECFEDFTDTLTMFYRIVHSAQHGRPFFLLGHSMGGLIASYYLLEHQKDFKGAVISAPSIKVSNVSKFTYISGRILAALFPKMGIVPLDATRVSRDPEVVKAYVNDSMVFHGKTSARLAVEIVKAMEHVSSEAGKITLPFIVLQGSGDKIVDPAGADLLYKKAESKDKTINIYEGLYHEIFNEPEKARVLKDVENWLKARLK